MINKEIPIIIIFKNELKLGSHRYRQIIDKNKMKSSQTLSQSLNLTIFLFTFNFENKYFRVKRIK